MMMFLDTVKTVLPKNKIDLTSIKEQLINRKAKEVILIPDIDLDEYSIISVDKHLLPEMELSPKAKGNTCILSQPLTF